MVWIQYTFILTDGRMDTIVMGSKYTRVLMVGTM